MFSLIHAKLTEVSRVAVWVGGAALLLSAIMVTLDVIARKLFDAISGSDEISGYVFAAGLPGLIHIAYLRVRISGLMPV